MKIADKILTPVSGADNGYLELILLHAFHVREIILSKGEFIFLSTVMFRIAAELIIANIVPPTVITQWILKHFAIRLHNLSTSVKLRFFKLESMMLFINNYDIDDENLMSGSVMIWQRQKIRRLAEKTNIKLTHREKPVDSTQNLIRTRKEIRS